MNKKMGFSLLELTFVIVVLSVLAMFAIPEYTKTHREAKVAVLTDLRGKLTNAVDTLKTASNIDSRKLTLNGDTYVKYDLRQSYRVSGNLLHPTEICHILGLTSAPLVAGTSITSNDGMYTCKNENARSSWVRMNKLKSTDCALSYRATYTNKMITSVNIELVGDCLESE